MTYTDRMTLIREYWRRYREMSGPAFKKGEPFCVPVQRPLTMDESSPVVPDHAIDVLEFRMERSHCHGRPLYRVACEGITVEAGP